MNSSLNVCNPKGELGVNSNLFEVESDSGFSEQLIVTYKNPDGRYEPTRITVRDSSGEIKPSDADEDKILNAKSNSLSSGWKKQEFIQW